MTIPISDIVSVSDRIIGAVTQRRTIGAGLLLLDSDPLSASGTGKVRSYTDAKSIGDDFGTTSEAYACAEAWFGQDPAPRKLNIGRWATTTVNTTLTGTTPDLDATTWDNSDCTFTIGGHDVDVDLSAITTAGGTDISTAEITTAVGAIQTAIRALATGSTADSRFSGATVAYANSVFTITLSGLADIGGSLGSGTSGGTAINTALGMEDADDNTYVLGHDQEEVDDALNEIMAVDDEPYYVMVDQTITAQPTGLTKNTHQAIAQWCNTTGRYIYSMGTTGADSLVTNETTSQAAQVFALGLDRVAMTWTDEASYACASIAARMGAVDYGAPGSDITAKFKQLPGFAASSTLTKTQKSELDRKRVNSYISVGGTAIYAEGVLGKVGAWWDLRQFTDWLSLTLETDIFEALVQAGKVPYTNAGLAVIQDVIAGVCETGIRAGAIAPGDVTTVQKQEIIRITGNSQFDGHLDNGWLAYLPAVSTATSQQRADRAIPPGNLWVTTSGAIHFASLTLEIV